MSDSTHTVTVRAFDSAYPGSMFDKPHGEYVERGDASSLAAALLELVAKHKRDAEDFEDALKQEKAERDALRAEVERLRGALGPFANYACPEPCDCHNCKARAALKGGAVMSKPIQFKATVGVFLSSEYNARLFDEAMRKGDHEQAAMTKEVYGDRRTYGPGEETTANARLISAAPDLLEALIAAEQALEHAGSHLHADRCREVIAKATGAAALKGSV